MRSKGTLGIVVGVLALVGTLVALPSRAAAQAVTGTLLGNVTDASGAAVPGATVTATEVETNVSRTAVSNETGNYIFSSLRSGTYSVRPSCRASARSCARTSASTSTRRCASTSRSSSGRSPRP